MLPMVEATKREYLSVVVSCPISRKCKAHVCRIQRVNPVKNRPSSWAYLHQIKQFRRGLKKEVWSSGWGPKRSKVESLLDRARRNGRNREAMGKLGVSQWVFRWVKSTGVEGGLEGGGGVESEGGGSEVVWAVGQKLEQTAALLELMMTID